MFVSLSVTLNAFFLFLIQYNSRLICLNMPGTTVLAPLFISPHSIWMTHVYKLTLMEKGMLYLGPLPPFHPYLFRAHDNDIPSYSICIEVNGMQFLTVFYNVTV